MIDVSTQTAGYSAIRVGTSAHAGRMTRRTDHERYAVAIGQCVDNLAEDWNGRSRQAAATAFQTGRWLDAWYGTIGRAIGEPFLIRMVDRRSGALAAMLPLVRRTEGPFRIVEFADNGVSDYNAPVLGPAAPRDMAGATLLWSALRGALADADLVRFKKMPAEIEGRINPLVLLPASGRSAAHSNVVAIEAGWDAYRYTLKRKFRKELGRAWRVFSKHEGAAFRRIEGPEEAARVLAALEHQQATRIRELGLPYRLGRPEIAAFYRTLTREGIADRSVILTALTRRDEVIGALLGIARGQTFVMIRISSASGWSTSSPGRLIISQTMQMLHGEGYRYFDFSIGDYVYKDRFGPQPRPLYNLSEALSPRGWPLVVCDRTRTFAARQPMLNALARRFTNRAGRATEVSAEPETD